VIHLIPESAKISKQLIVLHEMGMIVFATPSTINLPYFKRYIPRVGCHTLDFHHINHEKPVDIPFRSLLAEYGTTGHAGSSHICI